MPIGRAYITNHLLFMNKIGMSSMRVLDDDPSSFRLRIADYLPTPFFLDQKTPQTMASSVVNYFSPNKCACTSSILFSTGVPEDEVVNVNGPYCYGVVGTSISVRSLLSSLLADYRRSFLNFRHLQPVIRLRLTLS